MRRVKTASGATAVQIVHKRGRVVLGIDHVGSARDDAQLALLLEAAQARLHAGQQLLPFDDGVGGGRPAGTPMVEETASLIVWETLAAVYAELDLGEPSSTGVSPCLLSRINCHSASDLNPLGCGARLTTGRRSRSGMPTRPPVCGPVPAA